jgi:hypothetical protein
MAEPYNYNIASPTAAFQNAFAFGDVIAARDAERAKAAEERLRAQKAQAALQSVATDRSATNIARVLRDFPALKEQITSSEAVLNEDERQNANLFRAEVINLYRGGNKDAARARLQLQADGYARTPGKEKEAAASRDLLKSFDIDPDLSVILPLSLQLFQSDEKLYNKFYGGDENLSATGKEYQDRVRIQGKEKADAWLELQGEKLIAVEPGGAVYRGSNILGNGPITGRTAPPGITFKPLTDGGQTEKPSGNFR